MTHLNKREIVLDEDSHPLLKVAVFCQHVDKESRVTQLQFVGTQCGQKADADVNKAKNILKKAV